MIPSLLAASTGLRPGVIALAAWIGVAFFLLIRLGVTFGLERRIVRAGRRAPEPVTRLWRDVCAELGVAATEIRVVTAPVSPHLCFDGKLILPAALIHNAKWSGSLVHVFRHEAAHLRSGDQFWFPLISALTATFWFHPLVWWLARRHLISCEEARDAVAARLGGADAYRRSVADIAIGLLAPVVSSPALFRKSGGIVHRLNRLEKTSCQAPPVIAATFAFQTLLVLTAVLFGVASPSLQASLRAVDLFGLWHPVDDENRFARQLEVYEWGDEVKVKVWEATGDQVESGATVASFRMSREQFDRQLHGKNSATLPRRSGFSNSNYTLSRRGDQLEFRRLSL